VISLSIELDSVKQVLIARFYLRIDFSDSENLQEVSLKNGYICYSQTSYEFLKYEEKRMFKYIDNNSGL
jgi:hypothetical protein